MANTDSPLREIAHFAQLSGPHRYIVLLKVFHVRYKEIVRIIEEEYDISYSRYTLNQYFAAGGYLEQAYNEVRDQMVDEWVNEARQLAKLYVVDALRTLEELMDPSKPPKIRIAAASFVLSKLR